MSATKHALILAEEYLFSTTRAERDDRFERLVSFLGGDRGSAFDFVHDVVRMRRENGESVPKTF